MACVNGLIMLKFRKHQVYIRILNLVSDIYNLDVLQSYCTEFRNIYSALGEAWCFGNSPVLESRGWQKHGVRERIGSLISKPATGTKMQSLGHETPADGGIGRFLCVLGSM